MKKNSILPVFILAVLLATQYGKVSDNQYLKPDTLAAKQDFAQAKPLITSHFSADKPAPSQATLTWTVVTGAVLYEIEFLSASPEKRNSDEPSVHRVYVSRNIFTNGYHADFAALPESLLYWRVRALDYDGNPIGVFSDAAPLFIDRNKKAIPSPLTRQ